MKTKTQTSNEFRKCHLQILRSLYAARDEREGNETPIGKTVQDTSNASERIAVDEGNASEGPVDSMIWDLIERFLRRRMEYPPLKDRQIHWSNNKEEALARLKAATSEREETLPVNRLQMTPLTPIPIFSRSTTPSMSLTPLHSNEKAPNSIQTERAWNLISQMLEKRSKLCIDSCQSFRSQPFLAQLLNEAKMRCATLNRELTRLKVGTPRKPTPDEGGLGRKRRKLDDHSSLKHFFSVECSELTRNTVEDENHVDKDSVMETQMKLHLWSSLLSSVKEIVDIKEEL